MSRALPMATSSPPTLAVRPAAAETLEIRPAASRPSPSPAARSSKARAIGCSLPCCAEAARMSSRIGSSLSIAVTFGWPSVSVPVLSKTTTEISRARSSAAASREQDAPARADSRADDDRRRRRQAEGAGAGDHQDGDRRDEGRLPIAAPDPPADEGQDGEPQHHRHEDGAHPIDQLLDGRLARLGVLDQGDDPGEHALMRPPRSP